MAEDKNEKWTVEKLWIENPQEPGKIFTVTTLRRIDPNSGIGFGGRTVAWYKDFKDAEKCILTNSGDINECGYYPYAVVEEVEEGLYPINEKVWWFEWQGGFKNGGYKPIEQPEKLKNICNYSIG